MAKKNLSAKAGIFLMKLVNLWLEDVDFYTKGEIMRTFSQEIRKFPELAGKKVNIATPLIAIPAAKNLSHRYHGVGAAVSICVFIVGLCSVAINATIPLWGPIVAIITFLFLLPLLLLFLLLFVTNFTFARTDDSSFWIVVPQVCYRDISNTIRHELAHVLELTGVVKPTTESSEQFANRIAKERA